MQSSAGGAFASDEALDPILLQETDRLKKARLSNLLQGPPFTGSLENLPRVEMALPRLRPAAPARRDHEHAHRAAELGRAPCHNRENFDCSTGRRPSSCGLARGGVGSTARAGRRSNLDVFEQAVERVEPLQLPTVLGPHAPARRRPRTFWPMLENVPEDPGPESVKPAARRRRSKRTALGKMIRDRDVDGVASTLAASPELLSRPCEDGSLTPLMCAVLSGSRRMLRAVIRAGASLDALSSEGMTALDLGSSPGVR